MRWFVRITIICIAALLVYIGVSVFRAAVYADKAEHGLHAAILTVDLLNDYVDRNQGQWPSAWGDLEALPRREGGTFAWPQDSSVIQQHVSVDFTADPKRFIDQKPEDFDAVRPIGPCFNFRHSGRVATLLETIRKHHPRDAR